MNVQDAKVKEPLDSSPCSSNTCILNAKKTLVLTKDNDQIS